MNLNIIFSTKLLSFDYKKHFGLFVYLMNDYNEYKYGLYFGGSNGWKRLTNESPVYYGYSPYWDYSVYSVNKPGERLRDVLALKELPYNKEIVGITGIDAITFTMKGYDWCKKYNEKCTIWWFAIPTNCVIDNVIESDIITTDIIEDFAITNNDVYENGNNSKYTVNINMKDYYVYVPIKSKAYYASPNNSSYLTITLE